MIRQLRPLPTVLGPEHTGRRFTVEEFEQLDGVAGFRYELIGGVLHVSPAPDPIHSALQVRLLELISSHRTGAGKTFVHALVHARVMVDETQDRATNPEPDIAAYLDFPIPPPRSYSGIQPALVIEVVSFGGHNKDYARNPELYERVPEILEYWVIDPTADERRPIMTVFHRSSQTDEFDRLDVTAGAVYESRNWPGLRIDLGRIWE